MPERGGRGRGREEQIGKAKEAERELTILFSSSGYINNEYLCIHILCFPRPCLCFVFVFLITGQICWVLKLSKKFRLATRTFHCYMGYFYPLFIIFFVCLFVCNLKK